MKRVRYCHNQYSLVVTCCVLCAVGTLPAAQAAPVPDQRSVLPNGMTLVVRPERIAPRVAISLLVRVGAASETTETAGWRRLLAEAMLRATTHAGSLNAGSSGASRTAQSSGDKNSAGASNQVPPGQATPGQAAQEQPDPNVLTPVQLQRMAEAAGGRIGASVGDDVIEFWATGDSDRADELLNLVLLLVRHPRLGQNDVETARRRLMARLERNQDEVASRALSELRRQMYRNPRGEPIVYGLPEQGTRESLESLTTDKLREYHNRYFRSANFTVAVVGDVDAAALRARLEKVPATSADTRNVPSAPVFAVPRQTDPPLVVRQMETEFAWVFIGFGVVGYNHADYPALRVLAAALGEAPTGRLPRRLLSPASIGEDALALQASSVITPRRYASEFILFGQVDVSNVDEAKDAILDEVRKVRETPLTESELTRAKNFVLGSWAVDREGMRERAFEVALAPALDAPVDTALPTRVNAVTAADVRRIAQKYLQSYTVALIMPEE